MKNSLCATLLIVALFSSCSKDSNNILLESETSISTLKAVGDDTPPYVGSNFIDGASGNMMYRDGMVMRTTNWVYNSDPLSAFREKRGFVDPTAHPGILSNPYREDGTALNRGYYIPNNFTGHIPVYTEGNNWPFIGPFQPHSNYQDFETDAGLYFTNGTLYNKSEPFVVPGEDGAKVVNKTPYGILISSGSFPGNEQPGQVITIVNPNEEKPLPIPPKDWFYYGVAGDTKAPELYISVAGLDPMDVPGWHYSTLQPIDFGTTGFAYQFSTKYTKPSGQSSYFIMPGFNKNEGYDPALAGDPGYGVALYQVDPGQNKRLIAITDLYITSGTSAQQDLWGAPGINTFTDAQGGLSAGPSAIDGTEFIYEFISHEEAQQMLSGKSGVLHATF